MPKLELFYPPAIRSILEVWGESVWPHFQIGIRHASEPVMTMLLRKKNSQQTAGT